MRSVCSIVVVVILVGCGEPAGQPKREIAIPAEFETAPAQPPSPVAKIRQQLGIGKDGELKKVGDAIVAANLRQTKVTSLEALVGQALRSIDLMETAVEDLSPLEGQPVEELFAERTKVVSLEPLAELPLQKLYLSETPVADLTPLRGKRIAELNLVDTKVSDLTPLAECSLGTLWLRRCPIESIEPLANTRLQSLDVGETKVSDLTPLATISSLQRLHIAETDVTDLTPIASLPLTRLIFSPWKIEKGLDAIREMKTLQQLDVSFDDAGGNALRPEEFWRRWDAGEIESPKSE